MADNTGQISTKKIVAIFAGGLAVAVLLVLFAFPSSGIGQLFKGAATLDPGPPKLEISGGCTKGDLKNDGASICTEEGGFFVFCSDARNGNLELDGTYQCTSGKWIPYEEPPAPPATCTDNTLRNGDAEICQTNKFITCDTTTEDDLTIDKKYECSSGKWIIYVAPPPAPPAEPPVTLVDITDEEADPDSFSPLTRSTFIRFTVNKEAKIDVKIKDSEGKPVVTLTTDYVDTSDDPYPNTYEVEWYGTEDNKDDGTVVDPGTYKFVIVGKNKTTGVEEDREEGEVDVVYSTDDDPEDPSPSGTTTTPPPAPTPTPTPTPTPAPNQNQATMATQNRDTGRTSDTGPAMFIYLLAPVGGYLITRKYRK